MANPTPAIPSTPLAPQPPAAPAPPGSSSAAPSTGSPSRSPIEPPRTAAPNTQPTLQSTQSPSPQLPLDASSPPSAQPPADPSAPTLASTPTPADAHATTAEPGPSPALQPASPASPSMPEPQAPASAATSVEPAAAPDTAAPTPAAAPERTRAEALAESLANLQHVPITKRYDGIVCFGGVDWWYHNRGHYDLQLMRELAGLMPVLYINSIGMRFPSAGKGGMFAARLKRKLQSLSRGIQLARENFWVFSPVAIPGRRGRPINKHALPAQVKWAMKRCGISRPLVWVACPPAADAIDKIPHEVLVYQRTDRFEAFEGVDPALIRLYDVKLKQRADLTLYCSHYLLEQELSECTSATFIDHGVDYRVFHRAADDADASRKEVQYAATDPHDVGGIPRPRIGFVGGIDAHTFDPELFLAVAKRLSHRQFVLVGGCSLPEGWCKLPNVHMLGRKPYEEVASYMASFDVLLMPWNHSEWIRSCNPVKLKEYLATGRPVVSTSFPELQYYKGLLRIADTPETFAAAIEEALAQPIDPKPGRERVVHETWTHKASQLLRALRSKGIAASQADGRIRRSAQMLTDVNTKPTR